MRKEPGDKAEDLAIAPTEVTPPEQVGNNEQTHPWVDGGTNAPDTVADVSAKGVIGRFRLEGTLGSGGMADVYRAYDPMLDRDVALKVLRTKTRSGPPDRADDPQRMRRVLREARAAAALTHPNTVTIFDVGEADGEVFIAMELFEGKVLRESLGRRDVPLDQKLRWLLQAARALAAAHERGLVHRDVKPDNMFVCSDGTLKLLDFGIAKRDEDDSITGPPDSTGPSSMRTADGRRVGTPRYMAPEQHAGLPTDGRTDQYAWGLVAFELLTGAHPVASTVTTDSVEPSTGASTRLAALREKVPDLPEAIVASVTRALELRKEDRFPSMTPIVEALDRRVDIPSSTPKAVSQAPPPQRGQSRWRIAAGVVAIATIAGAATLWGVTRARTRTRALAGVGTTGAAARTAPPACRIESTRTIPMAADDRFALLPDGTVVVARNIKQGLVLERETPNGNLRFSKNAFLDAVGSDFTDLGLRGSTHRGAPAVLLEIVQSGPRGSLVVMATEGDTFSSHRVRGSISGLAVEPFGQDFVTVVTSLDQTPPGRTQAYLVGKGVQQNTVEVGQSSLPALATTANRVAVAYYVRAELHLSILDESAQRIGDVQTITPTPREAPAAVAFAGATAAVFWTDNLGPKTRLTMATFTPGDAAASAPRIAIDDPLTLEPPLTARLPSGDWAVAWVASSGGLSTLRVSPIGPGGVLTGPTDVATLARFVQPQVTSGKSGLHFSWHETDGSGATVAKIVRVACAPKAP